MSTFGRKKRGNPSFKNRLKDIAAIQDEEEQAMDLAQLDIEYADYTKSRADYNQVYKAIEALDNELPGGAKQTYSIADRLYVALCYLITANMEEVSRRTGIRSDRIRHWKTRASWWPLAMEYAREQRNHAWDARYGEIRDLVLKETVDRLKHGDKRIHKERHVDKETKEVSYKYVETRTPIPAKDMMIIESMAAERQALMKGEPTSIVRKEESKEDLAQSIADKISKAVKDSGRTIEGIVVEKSKN